MGVDYYARAVIGLRVAREKLPKEPARRGCDHPETTHKFCPQCGQPMWRMTDQRLGMEDVPGLTEAGLAFTYDTDHEYYFITVRGSLISTSSDRDESSAKKTPLLTDDLNIIRQRIKDFAELRGWWDESEYGLWAVLYCLC